MLKFLFKSTVAVHIVMHFILFCQLQIFLLISGGVTELK
jgi:hypothetical protein